MAAWSNRLARNRARRGDAAAQRLRIKDAISLSYVTDYVRDSTPYVPTPILPSDAQFAVAGPR